MKLLRMYYNKNVKLNSFLGRKSFFAYFTNGGDIYEKSVYYVRNNNLEHYDEFL